MSLRDKHQSSHQAGFSLVEILVGLVIGLLATLVIMQVFSVFEGQKRTTTGTADAQTNGSIALYTITRQLQSAGFAMLPWGVPNTLDALIDCPASTLTAAAIAAGVSNVSPLSPVIITDGGNGSDSITIRSGTSSTAGVPAAISLFAPNYRVKNALGCPVVAGAAPGAAPTIAVALPSCSITTVTNSVNNLDALGNIDSATLTLGSNVPLSDNQLFCLGQWNNITYGVTANNLTSNNTPVVSDIVSIQAQYGIAATGLLNPPPPGIIDPNFNQVIQWVDATGATWAAPSTANRNRIKAVRIAVIARNGLMEKTNVSRACGSAVTSAAAVCAWPDLPAGGNLLASPAPNVDLSGNANWQQYRYRVFETIIPLRNVMWSKGTL